MSFIVPLCLLLLVPLVGFWAILRHGGRVAVGRLPGAWHHVVSHALRGYVAARSNLGKAGVPVLCFAIAVPVVIALARPGIDTQDDNIAEQLSARIIILDVGADLTGHRHFLDALMRASPGVATSVLAVAEDAYRIIPFTTDHAQIDRYVRVLNADMMPRPGQKPHIALADAERSLADAGFPACQVVLITARGVPDQTVVVPPRQSSRYVVALGTGRDWQDWAEAQGAVLASESSAREIVESLSQHARQIARAEIPTTRRDFTEWFIGLAAILWVFLFRRGSA